MHKIYTAMLVCTVKVKGPYTINCKGKSSVQISYFYIKICGHCVMTDY